MPSHYDQFYSTKAWVYDMPTITQELNDLIVKPLGLKPGDKILEIGGGQGYHSQALHNLGFDVTCNDISEVGIKFAKEHWNGPTWICSDSAELVKSLPKQSFDMILVRGHSRYHYAIKDNTRLAKNTKEIMTLLKPEGYFVLQIVTDFTGNHPKGKGKVWMNLYDDYVDFFSALGEVKLVSDWSGKLLHNDEEARASGKGIIIATQAK